MKDKSKKSTYSTTFGIDPKINPAVRFLFLEDVWKIDSLEWGVPIKISSKIIFLSKS